MAPESSIRESWKILQENIPSAREAKLIRIEPSKDDDTHLTRCEFCQAA